GARPQRASIRARPRRRSDRIGGRFAAIAHDRLWQILLQKSFPLVTKNSPGCRRDFRVKMWGTSSPDDKLTGDLAEAPEATKIAGRRSDRPMAGKLSPGNFGLLQQYLPRADITRCSKPWVKKSTGRPAAFVSGILTVSAIQGRPWRCLSARPSPAPCCAIG